METERKQELKSVMKQQKKNWIAVVKNHEANFTVSTNFFSDCHTIEQILHKIELDLMTSLNLGLDTPIEVRIKEVKKYV